MRLGFVGDSIDTTGCDRYAAIARG